MITIAIIEDDTFILEELVATISKSDELECIMSASSAERFFKYYNKEKDLDILLTDINLPGMSGIETIVKLKNISPTTEAIVLSSYHDNDTVFKALRAGATGYLLKDTPIEEIEQKLIDVKQGTPPLSPAIAKRMFAFFNSSGSSKNQDNLTEKEIQVLKLLVHGLSYKEIASQIGISIDGIRFRVKKIYKKLHVSARPQLMKLYIDGKLNYI